MVNQTTTIALGITLIVLGAVTLLYVHLLEENRRLQDGLLANRIDGFTRGIAVGKHLAQVISQHETPSPERDADDGGTGGWHTVTMPSLTVMPRDSHTTRGEGEFHAPH
jgi:hypothetical protein